MLRNERNAILALGLIMSCRMLGIFMILPVFSSSVLGKADATSLLVGLALGIYGLTQACLQIPFGCWSDHIGRKKVIFFGLILFGLGSLAAAFSTSMLGLIIGRGLQGAGAIGSTVLALAADLTREEDRSKAMALIGMTIGLSFAVALILGPLVHYWFDLSGVFLTTAMLAVLAMLVLWAVPTPSQHASLNLGKHDFYAVLTNHDLIHLNLGIFVLHTIFTATFIGLPLLLAHTTKLTALGQVGLYLGVLTLAFLLMIPFMLLSEQKKGGGNKQKPIYLGAIAAFMLAELVFAFVFCVKQPTTLLPIAATLLLFFTAFTLLETTLPASVSRMAPPQRKGAAMGIYSTSQFLGIFAGGSLGGLLFSHLHLFGLFASCAVLTGLWLFSASCKTSCKTLIAKNN